MFHRRSRGRGHNLDMASPDLRRLWKLHQIDAAIIGIRNRAANLDVGRKLTVEIETLSKQLAEHPYKKLHAEQQDLELKQKSIDDKIEKFNKELYGGKVVNPREVENFQKEITMLTKQKGDIDDTLIGILDQLPPLKVEADKVEKAIAERKVQLVETQKKAQVEKVKLEADFKKYTAERPEAAKNQNPTLLAKYETLRKNHEGTGMAEVVKKRQCGACGTLLPERTLQGLLDDKTMSCETCHRLLYFTEGVV